MTGRELGPYEEDLKRMQKQLQEVRAEVARLRDEVTKLKARSHDYATHQE